MFSKEPGLCIIPNHPEHFQPIVVVETSWLGRLGPVLLEDAKLWLLGGQPYVQVVITICYSNDDGRIKSGLKIYKRGASRNSVKKQEVVDMSLSFVEKLHAKSSI